MTNNTIANVPRELLERVLYLMDNYIGTTHTEEDELRALLSAPSPAGVDGLNTDRNAALKAQEPVANSESGLEEWAAGKFGVGGAFRGELCGNTDWALARLVWSAALAYAAPVSEAKAQGVVQWPEADEIMQMAFEEGQPADDASGYCFELEEFDLFIERLMSEVARLNAAQAAPAADAWIPVSERLPESGQTVLAFYLNSHGKGRRIRAQYIKAWTVDVDDLAAPDTECVEYSEQMDCYYLLQGWYECIDNWDEYYRVAVTEGPITHWMPIPAAPIKIEANRHD